MKYHEDRFVDYVTAVENKNLHPKLESKIYSILPETINDLPNLIFYGPEGVGKYSQALYCIKKYSASELKYEKKISFEFQKGIYNLKISDIHFEIDMDMLGCNSKTTWNDIYCHIIDIINSNSIHKGIILCKNFHNINNELLDIFYSYMQDNSQIKYILLSNELSFIPDIVLNKFEIINIGMFTKSLGNRYINKKYIMTNNIKYSKDNVNIFNNICDKYSVNLINYIKDYKTIKYSTIRDFLYDMLIYNINIGEVIWCTLIRLINNNDIKSKDIPDVLFNTYTFLQLYNNNYRPIYHLEKFFYYLLITVNEL